MLTRNYLKAASLLITTLAILTGCSSASNQTAQPPSSPQNSASSAASTETEQIAFVTNGTSDYWTIARKGVEAQDKQLGTTTDFVMPADGTAATQKQMVDDLVAKGVKAIAISPVDPTNQTPWLDQVASNVALITQDSDAPQSKRLMYIGTDNHAAGLMAGRLIKEALGPAGGKIVLFVGKSDAQNAKDRIQGIRDALTGTNVTILDVRTDDADHARAKANAADELVKYPDIAAEVGIWSYNGPAILSAVQDAGKMGKVKIVCFDEEDNTLAGVKAGSIYATVVQQPYQFGFDGTKILADLAKGDKSDVPKSGVIFVPTQAIKQSNVDAFKAKLDKLRGRTS